jgi:hypothetical protein
LNAPACHAPCLIVNADDFGYFPCVSRGILNAAAEGVVTATGVLANAEGLVEQAAWLRDREDLDAGVHLNATYVMPLTVELRRKLRGSSERFPGKFSMAMKLLARVIGVADVEREWRAQIERCLEQGLLLRFLNSHEHIHMLPPLFHVAQALAREYGIAHVRFASAGRPTGAAPAPLLRAGIMWVLEAANRRSLAAPVPRFLGLESSGRLTEADIEGVIASLLPGEVAELMCHPGEFDPSEIGDERLLAYHDWVGELRALTGVRIREALCRHGVRLVGYRHLSVEGGRLVVRAAPQPV